MPGKWFVFAVLIVLAGCGKKDTVSDETPVVEQPIRTPVASNLDSSKCHGKKVPPTNYVQETAFAPLAPDAMQIASDTAQARLRDRICQGYRCGELAPKIRLWNTDSDATQACAMAVIKSTDVEEFKSGPRRTFDADLAERAAQIVQYVQRTKEPRVAFDSVTDLGVDGGERAEWLVGRMTAALSGRGAVITSLPADWSGLRLPKGTDAVLRATITPMNGREAMLEVTWKVELTQGRKAVDSVAFPELIGPYIDPASQLTPLPAFNADIGLHFDARPGGGLCNGQTTELRLETAKDLHVRVINLFGDGSRGIVIYASPEEVKTETPMSFGKFSVVKATEVPVERFVALGSKSRTGLGVFADVTAPCRIPTDLATSLSQGGDIPYGAKKFVSSKSYRILEGEECASFTPQTMSDDWYESIPTCF